MAPQTETNTANIEELPTFLNNASETFNSKLDSAPSASGGTFTMNNLNRQNGQSETSHRDLIRDYFAKWCGNQPGLFPVVPPIGVLVWTFIGTFLGVVAIAATGDYAESFFVDRSGLQERMPTAIGSFGALAVLVYGNVDSPLAQPRNVFFGNMISALIGASVAQLRLYLLRSYMPTDLLNDPQLFRWLAAGISVACSHTAMQVTRTVHPPGGAAALIAVLGSPAIEELGFTYVIAPVLTGVLTMLGVALVVNNIARRYPLYWWTPKSQPMGPKTQQGIVAQNARLSHVDFKSRNYRSEDIEMTKRRDMVHQNNSSNLSDASPGEDPDKHLRGDTLREQSQLDRPFDNVMILDNCDRTAEGRHLEIIYLREQLKEATSRKEELERRLEDVQNLRASEV